MGDHDSPGTCLSSDPRHQRDSAKDVRDVLLHYFGCLKRQNRKAFYDSADAHQKLRIREEHRRIRSHRALFEARDDGLVYLLTANLSMLRQSKDFKELENPGPADDVIEPGPEDSTPAPANRYGLNANMILFKNSKKYTDKDYPDEFPNQKIPLDELLYSEDGARNPLVNECPPNTIRYFHLPANNMSWVEEAIARHYNEKVPEYEGIFRRPEHPSQTYMMLRPEFWRGQQHGGRKDAIHARHMRPRCDIISTDPDSLEDSPKNMVLFVSLIRSVVARSSVIGAISVIYERSAVDGISTSTQALSLGERSNKGQMPYLHWETDRRRSKCDEILRNIAEEHKEREDKRLAKARSRVAAEVAAKVANQNGKSKPAAPQLPTAQKNTLWPFGRRKKEEDPFEGPQNNVSQPKRYKPPLHTLTEVVDAKVKATQKRTVEKTRAEKGKPARTIMPCTILGLVLFRAAILSEAMEYHHDQELLRDNLHRTPPLHPRRTLDQSYYWTLKTTKKRDRDQVVYRGTAPQKEFMHHHTCKKNKEQCDHHHCTWTKEEQCDQCQRDIRKVARIVMVDQLWLWILDGNTIITCFPKRWGRNKPDPSAVHKSLRLRLKVARKDEIRSVYDLALIIIDQCSRVFFDRTKTADRQPRVMDLFANAIGDVANKQTLAYEHFWYYTQQASEIYKSKDLVETSGMAKVLLDINPEGKLVREIKDILDELNIMIQIKKHQERVLAEFLKHAKHISEEMQISSPAEAQAAAAEDKRAEWWRKEYAHDIEAGLKDRVAELNNLRESAENAEKALDGLLSLKQQQASVVHAREAVRQAEETLRQGRSIMLFTVITIIFLPLTFFTGVYGMNNIQFNNGNYDLYTQLTFMLPISLGIILTSFILAFSTFVRATLALLFSLSWTYLVTRTRLYELWVEFRIDSASLAERRKRHVRVLKEQARGERQARRERMEEERAREVARRDKEGEGARVRVRMRPEHLLPS